MFSPGAATILKILTCFAAVMQGARPPCSRGQIPTAAACFVSAAKSPVAFVFYLADNLTDW
jgi:hypothetical protein